MKVTEVIKFIESIKLEKKLWNLQLKEDCKRLINIESKKYKNLKGRIYFLFYQN